MHLRQVKISGFKSFADTATVEFPSGFVGIVGPNGCGKSNVIDAVRWVMGEGRAGELRATASMQELIFSGSDGRAPSGRASVEMVLDNSDGTLPGPWGAYAEVAVKRILNREGQSAYFINGQPVRRRDVQDIFMGTGLGPRSYAIISQGMVSSFVKAKPEELRVYFEEAAGVSRYKERRREAEGRLEATRGNLDRVSDLQSMREEEIKRLGDEAEIARKWQALTSRRERFAGIWFALQEHDARDNVNRIEAEIAKAMAEVEGARARAASLLKDEAAAEEILADAREEERVKQDAVNSLGLALAKTQGALAMLLEKKKLLEERIRKDKEKLERAAGDTAGAGEKAAGFEAEAERLEEEAAGLEDESSELEEAAARAKERLEAAREEEKRLAADENVLQRQLMEVTAKQQGLGRERATLQARIERLSAEKSGGDSPDKKALERARRIVEECEASLEDYEAEQEAAREEEAAASEEEKEAQRVKTETTAKLAGIEAKITALEDIQKKAKAEGKLPGWARRHGLEACERLVTGIRVESGWERAVEAALSARLTALETEGLEGIADLALDPPPARLALVDLQDPALPASGPVPTGSLTEKVTPVREAAGRVIRSWLSGFRIAPSLEAAIAGSRATPGATFITKEGHTASSGCVLFWAPESPAAGLLERAGELARLNEEKAQGLDGYKEILARALDSGKRLEASRKALREAESSLEQARREHHAETLRLNQLESAYTAWQQRTGLIEEQLEASRTRLEEIAAEAEELEAQFEERDETLSVASQRHQDAELAEEAARTESERAEEALRTRLSQIQLLRSDAQHARERAKDANDQRVRHESSEAELTASLEEARAELEELDEDAGRADVTGLVQRHDAAEKERELASAKLAQADQALAGLQASRRAISEAERPQLERVGELKVKQGALEAELSALTAQIEERRIDRERSLAEAAADDWTAAGAKREVSKTERQIEELGPVNHAALENLEAAKKALNDTEAQAEDLQKAIETLEAAIHKIDTETRAVLKDTFDKVNGYFSEIFRTIFSGGSAALEMTGEEVLQAGIEIKAQPPGKRNASVKLLSGGEQALTATALVFALFKLNPAPFCLLDEVDAPLDEANQTRLANLIESMSGATQFVAITHHRITMEHASQLIGVTMKEPGVSRVVSVDIQEAVQYSKRQLTV